MTPTYGEHGEQQYVVSMQPVKCQGGTWRKGTATYEPSERYLPFRQILTLYCNCNYYPGLFYFSSPDRIVKESGKILPTPQQTKVITRLSVDINNKVCV